MRVGIKVLRNGQPAVGVALVPNLPLTTGFPLIPAFPRTDVNGEWFGVVPLAISPAVYLMDVVVDPEGSSIRINGSFDEIEPQLFVDLSRPTGERQRLGDRIPRAGYFEVDHRLLQPKEIVNVAPDPGRFGSNGATCQYFVVPGMATGFGAVNGLRTPAIPLPDARNNSCCLYYPFFLPPSSPQRLAGDIGWRIPTLESDQRSFRLTPALPLSLPGKVEKRAP